MDGFKNLEIKSFRNVGHMMIDDFLRVNVFWGFGCGVFGGVEGVFGEDFVRLIMPKKNIHYGHGRKKYRNNG